MNILLSKSIPTKFLAKRLSFVNLRNCNGLGSPLQLNCVVPFSSRSKPRFFQQNQFLLHLNSKRASPFLTYQWKWDRKSSRNWEWTYYDRQYATSNEDNPQTNRQGPTLFVRSVVGVIQSIVATGCLWVFYCAYMGYASQSWVPVEATLTDCYVTVWSGSRLGIEDLEYVFTVDGVEYRGDRLAVGQFWFKNFEVMPIGFNHLQFIPGKKVTVYYNPRNPKSSTIVTGIDDLTKAVSFLCCAFFLLPIIRVSFFSLSKK